MDGVRRFTAALAVLVLCGLLGSMGLLFSQQEDDPHANQPQSCNNYFKTAKEHRCNCHKATTCARHREPGEDPKCQTYCRPTACKCIDPCTS